MIYKRKYLYGRETVGDIRELDYLQTKIVLSDLLVKKNVIITDDFAYRPDLIAKSELGNYHFGWLIMDFNDILDPYKELYTGKVISIPDISAYFDFYNEASKISKEDRRKQ